MIKRACIILGRAKGSHINEYICIHDLIYAVQTKDILIDSKYNFRNKAKTLRCSELKNGQRIHPNTLGHIVAPFWEHYYICLIATSAQVDPHHLIQILEMPHIKNVFYEINCHHPKEAIEFLINTAKYCNKWNHLMIIEDSNSRKVESPFKPANIVHSNKYLSISLHKNPENP